MGKRRRRINNPKFAVKFAKTRETYHKLRQAVEDVVENITETVESVVNNIIEPVEETVDVKEECETKIPNGLTFASEEKDVQVETPKVEKTTKKSTPRKPTPRKPAAKKVPTTKKTATTARKRRTTKTK